MKLLSSLLLVAAALCAAQAPSSAQCDPNSLTTTFLDNNGQSGNMFNLVPNVDLTVSCFDVNSRAVVGGVCSFNLYYRNGPATGFEMNAAAWTFLGNYSGVAAGRGLPTNVSVAGNGVNFLAGQTYGMYLDAGASGGLAYTNGGPTTYANADLTLTTHCGNATNFGSIFTPREWNGTVYYDPGCSSVTLSVTGATAGGTATATVDCATPGGAVVLGYSLAGGGPVNVNAGCALVTVSLSPPFTQVNLTANASGTASFTTNVPPGTTGVNVWTQAFDVTSCTLTTGVQVTL